MRKILLILVMGCLSIFMVGCSTIDKLDAGDVQGVKEDLGLVDEVDDSLYEFSEWLVDELNNIDTNENRTFILHDVVTGEMEEKSIVYIDLCLLTDSATPLEVSMFESTLGTIYKSYGDEVISAYNDLLTCYEKRDFNDIYLVLNLRDSQGTVLATLEGDSELPYDYFLTK